jgi:hypothetical protein
VKYLFSITMCLLCVSAPAVSAPIRWTLHDVLLSDGATATGSFVFDADTLTVSEVSIFTSAGSALSGAAYLGGVNYSRVPSGFWFQFHEGEAVSPGLIPTFDLIVVNPLSNAGGSVTVQRINEGTCTWTTECDGGVYSRWDTRGVAYVSSSVVPIPAAIWLFASGLINLAFRRRRKIAL